MAAVHDFQHDPGFAEQQDALSTLLMAIIFLLVVYVLAQFVLSRLLQGRERGEPVVIFGDYDVDGASSSALLQAQTTSSRW